MNYKDLGEYLEDIDYKFHNIHEFRAYMEAAKIYCNGLKYYMIDSNITEKYITMKVSTNNNSWNVYVYL